MAELFFPPGVRYTCLRCGECCRSLEVTLTEAEHERLVAHDWTAEVPGYSAEGFFARIRRARGRQVWRLRPHPGGACRFLTEEGLCRVHAALGPGAKPFAGRLFPFTFTVTPIGVFVGCRFNCPAVARGKGPTLEEQRTDIKRLFEEYARAYNPPCEPEPVRFFGRLSVGWRDAVSIEDQLLAFLLLSDLDLPRRLLACWRLVRQFAGQAAGGRGGKRAEADPDAILAELRRGVTSRGPSGMERVLLRLLVASFLGATLPGCRELPAASRMGTRAANLRRRLTMALGRGRVQLPGLPEPVPIREAAAVALDEPDAASVAMLERYFAAKVTSQAFFGRAFFRRSFAEGFEFLVLSYPAILWLAGASAASGGKRHLGADDVEYGIRQADYAYNYLGEFGGRSARMRAKLFWHWGTAEKALAALTRQGT